MTDESRSRLWTAAVIIVAIVAVALPVYAITFDTTYQSDTRFAATPDGPTIHFNEDRTLPSGNPFPAANSIHIQTASGSAYYNGTADTTAQVDEINGTWSNVSELDVTSGNLTINPQAMDEAAIAGDADDFAFKGQATVEDGKIDAKFSGTGTANVTLTTDGTPGTQYGLVDLDTNEGLAVDVVNANGVGHFTEAELSDHEVDVQELGTLTIREEADDPPDKHQKITNSAVEVRFFSEPDGETIVNREDDDGDGEVDLTGLPTDESFVATINADDHPLCTVLIEDLADQETAFCLNTTSNTDTVETTFQIDDQTGNFDSPETEIIIQRAINQSRYKSNADWKYLNVRGDQVGSDREYTTTLHRDKRYRIRIRNADGDLRQLGAFTPKNGGIQTLDIGSVTVNQTDVDSVAVNATLANTTNDNKVVVNYNDTQDLTEELYIEIHEYRNRSNKLLSNTSFTGPLGEASVSESIPQAENETEWVVRITANRGEAEDYNSEIPLSPRRNLLPGLPNWLAAIMSIGLIWITAGLFSQINGDIGALVTAGMGAMLWFVDFVPASLGVGVVILSMVTAALIFINQRRDGGL